MDIGRALRRVAAEEGMTQARLSRVTGLPDSHVSQIWRSKIHDPTASIVWRLCAALRVDMGDFMREAMGYPDPEGR